MAAIGLDIGSTSIKGAVLAASGGIVGEVEKAAFPEPVQGLGPGSFEVDPERVRIAAMDVLSRLLARAPGADRLYLCGQMGGAILVDGGGRPASRYVSWRDQRSLDAKAGIAPLDSARNRIDPATLDDTGRELKPGSTSVLLHALAMEGAKMDGLHPATIGDAFAASLCGVPPRMHPTMAIGLIDLRKTMAAWHEGMVRALGLGNLGWTRPADLAEPVGHARVEGKSLEVYSTVGDQQCALLGAELEPGELSLNASTGAQVSRIVPRHVPGPSQGRAYFGGLFLETITHIPAGRALHALVDLLTEVPRAQGLPVGDPWGTLTRLMAGREATDLEVDLAFFPSPVGDAGRVGNITLGNLSAGDLLAAATRNLADNLFACAKRLDPAASWTRARLSGGLSHSLRPLVGRLEGLLFPSPVVESGQAEETLAGLARIAAARGEPLHGKS